MRLAAIIDRLDDRINPIVVKELRQAVRSRAVVAILLVFLGLQLFLVGLNLVMGGAANPAGTGGASIDWTAGRDVFRFLQGVLLVTLMILVPAYACVRLAGERADHNVDLLFISTLKPHSIIAGKFFAALMLALLIFSACAPFMAFTYLLRGIDIPTIAIVLGIDLLCMVTGTMVALFLAALPGGRVVKIFVCVVGFILLLILCIWLVAGTVMMIQTGVQFMDSREFWTISGIFISGTLGWVGLLFVYSVALVSPATSNRVMPIRLYVLTVWLLSAAALLVVQQSTTTIEFPIVLIVWTSLFMPVLGLQFLISLCERDHWGPRVARAIPRRWWLRVPAFFLYTGAAGGLAFSLVLITLTLLSGAWWLKANELHSMHEGFRTTLALFLISVFYLYCYGLSAVLVRVYLLSGQIRAGFTWVVVMLLVGLGSAVPAPIALMFFPDQIRAGTDAYWWKLPSPFLAVNEAIPFAGSRIDTDFVETCFWFMSTWALLVTLGCLPWFLGQVRRFHRPEREEPLVVEAVEVPEVLAPGPAVNGTRTAADPAKVDPPSEHVTSIQPG